VLAIEELFNRAKEHLRWHHGKTSETGSTQEYTHAIVRVAVAFLIS